MKDAVDVICCLLSSKTLVTTVVAFFKEAKLLPSVPSGTTWWTGPSVVRCGCVSHSLGGTNKLLACHETMSSIGIIFIDVVVGRSWLVGGRSMSQCCFLQGFESDSRIFARFTNYSTVVASSRKPSGVVVIN